MRRKEGGGQGEREGREEEKEEGEGEKKPSRALAGIAWDATLDLAWFKKNIWPFHTAICCSFAASFLAFYFLRGEDWPFF